MTSSLLYLRYTQICVTVVIAMMTFHSAESVTCYSCTQVYGVGSDNCKVVNNQTGTTACPDKCQALVPNFVSGTVIRGCSTGVPTVCQANIGCVTTCTTDLCNNQNTSQSASVAFLLILAAVVGHLTQKNF